MPVETPSTVVSVVLPVYAGDDPEQFAAALASVAAQTLTELECLIVVDGPIGAELTARLEGAVGRDGRFRAIRLAENRGPGVARNHGIAEAAGRYVALLDADDLAEPERFARQRAHIEATGATLVGSWYSRIGDAGDVRDVKRLPVSAAAVRRWMPLLDPIANSTVFARTDALRAHPFREDYRYGEDYDVWVRLALAGHVLCNLPEPLVRLRVGSGFLDRRGGWSRFRTDLANKTRATGLYPVWARPALWPIAFGLAACRLLPAPALRTVYRIRDGLRFGAAAGR